MDSRTALLTIVKANSWVTKITKFELVMQMGDYGFNQNIAEQTLSLCIRDGLVVIVRQDRVELTARGLKFILDEDFNEKRLGYTNSSHKAANSNASKVRLIDWTKWGTIFGGIALLFGFFTFYFDKCRVNKNQNNKYTTQQNYNPR